ncbi:hypothetical protein [Paenarthrobacter sp. NPDC091669]|uniref:hypothetical protein n=1 Tax=Paenarthrobacter sp. NPDC091669 TaxID=3364384 RepID=UPI003808F4FD
MPGTVAAVAVAVGARAATACSLDMAAIDGGGVAGPVAGATAGVGATDVSSTGAHAANAADAMPAIPSSTDRRPAKGRRLESPLDVLN